MGDVDVDQGAGVRIGLGEATDQPGSIKHFFQNLLAVSRGNGPGLCGFWWSVITDRRIPHFRCNSNIAVESNESPTMPRQWVVYVAERARPNFALDHNAATRVRDLTRWGHRHPTEIAPGDGVWLVYLLLRTGVSNANGQPRLVGRCSPAEGKRGDGVGMNFDIAADTIVHGIVEEPRIANGAGNPFNEEYLHQYSMRVVEAEAEEGGGDPYGIVADKLLLPYPSSSFPTGTLRAPRALSGPTQLS